MKKLLSLFLVLSIALGVSGCSNEIEQPKQTVKKANKAKEKEDKVIEYEYTFHSEDYKKPKYNAVKCADLGNYKRKKIVVSGVRPEYTDKDVINNLNNYLDQFSTIKKSKSKTLGSNDAVLGILFNKSEYEKDTKDDEDVDESDYTYDDSLINLKEIGKDALSKFKKAKVDDTISFVLNGADVDFTIETFGMYEPFTVDDVDKDWLIENTSFKSLKKLKKDLKAGLIKNSRNVIYNTIYTALADTCSAEVPEDLLMYHLNKELVAVDVRIGSSGNYKNLEDYFEKVEDDLTLDEYVEKTSNQMREFLESRLIMEAIAKVNKIKPDESLYDEFLQYSYDNCEEEFEDVESYVYDTGEEELRYNFENIYMTLVWCKEHLNIKYE